MPRTTYFGRGVAKLGAGGIIAGSGEAMSSAAAYLKEEALELIQQEFFQDTSKYKGGDIAFNDCLQAIKYARSKKLTKAFRQGVKGGIRAAAFVVGAASGATMGSVVPVAGTLAGGAIGGVALSTAVGGTVTLLDRMKRCAKGIYKTARHTRGEHRKQAANAFVYCAGTLPVNDPKQKAAVAALAVILDDEFEEVMDMDGSQMVARIAERLKSN